MLVTGQLGEVLFYCCLAEGLESCSETDATGRGRGAGLVMLMSTLMLMFAVEIG